MSQAGGRFVALALDLRRCTARFLSVMSNPSNRRLSDRKLESQARACANAVAQLLWQALVARRPADRALSGYLRNHRECGSRDRRLISETFFAVLRWWGWLHDFAPPFPDEQPEPERIAAEGYARLLLGAWLLEDAPLPDVADVWQGQLGLAGNLSGKRLPVARRWQAIQPLGEETRRRFELTDLVPSWCFDEIGQPCEPGMLVDWLQLRPPVWLRAQVDPAQALRELAEAELDPKPHPARADAIAIEPPRLNLRNLPCFRDGHLEIQDLASQTIAGVCAPKPGERWWDTCAGAGGKTLHLATLMASKGSIVASDIRTYKLDDLKKRARRAGFSNIRCREWKGKDLPAKKGGFDGVLVDAPCTCSGTWRRNPDARWTLERQEIAEFADKQLSLLNGAAGAVRSGGTLVYATCSMFGAENEGVVRAFLASRPDFELESFPHPLGAGVCPGQLRIWPWDGDCDAMFVARFRRS
jgi:16S rRNA (cytosine967-C5)-methyltransferase